MTDNPYAPPAPASPSAALSSEEATRRRFLSHETSVKSISSYLMLGSLFGLFFGPTMIVGGVIGVAARDYGAAVVSLSLGGLLLFVGIVQVATASGIRRLAPWARTIATILSVFYLLAIPVGPFISGYCLYLLLSQKGGVVFSEEYKSVIEATPHIAYRTSPVVVLLLILLASLLVVGFGALLIG